MNLNETARFMAVIKTAYPKFYAYQRESAEMQAAVKLWAEMLGDYSYEAASRALADYIRHETQPPTIADIRRRLEPKADVGAQWQQLLAAAHKAEKYMYWHSHPLVCYDENGNIAKTDGRRELAELFGSLPPACREFAGSPAGLADIGRTGLDEYQRSRFMRLAASSAQSAAQLPPARFGQIEA